MKGFKSVKVLDISKNGFRNIPNDILGGFGIESLNISLNKIRELRIENLEKFEKLGTLNLSKNSIRTISEPVVTLISEEEEKKNKRNNLPPPSPPIQIPSFKTLKVLDLSSN